MLFAPSEPVYMAVHEPNGYKGDIRTTLWGTLPTVRSWNWEGHEGDSIEVEVTSHHPGVRLYRDNTLVGQSSTGREEEYKTVFKLPYQPGMLRAVAVNNVGNEVSPADTLYTAGTPTQLRITADREQLTADNQDLAYITIEVLDEKGHPVPHRPIDVHVSATGAGSVIATGSGDMTDEKGYYRTSRTTWQGRAIAVIKSTHRAGDIVVRVTSPGIKDAVIKLKAVKSTLHK
jgi:beta-galactosidase